MMKATQRLYQWMGWTKKDEHPLYDSSVSSPSTTSPNPSPPHAMWYTTTPTSTLHHQFNFDSTHHNVDSSKDDSIDLENQNQSEPHQITDQHVRTHCCSLCTIIKRFLLRRSK